MSKLKVESNTGQACTRFRFAYGEHSEFEAWIIRSGQSPVQSHLHFPTHRLYVDGTSREVPWTMDLLIDALQQTLRNWRNTYRGEWRLEIRTPKPLPKMHERDPQAARKARDMYGDLLTHAADAAVVRPMPAEPERIATAEREPGEEG